jgi:hypothetical protein
VKKLIFFAILALVVFSNSNGPGTLQRRDRTGSPLAVFSTCAECHFGGNFQAKMELSLLKDTMPVDYYIPGEEYVLKIGIEASQNAREFGFQTVALIDSSYINAGIFFDLPEFTQTVELLNRVYVEHSRPLQKKEILIGWKAPDEMVGDVLFYAAGVAANDDNRSNGDQPMTLDAPLTISSQFINSVPRGFSALDVKIRNNPVSDYLVLEGSSLDIEAMNLILVDQRGSILRRERVFSNGIFFHQIDVSEILPGVYFLVTQTQKASKTIMVVKI